MNKPLTKTTATINTQRSYITLKVHAADGTKVNYTTSYGGSKMSGSGGFLDDKANFSAMFRAFENCSSKPGENEGKRFERLQTIALQANDGQELLTLLQASRTSEDDKRECRRLAYVSRAPSDNLPADSFGRTIQVRTAKGMTDVLIDGYSERAYDKIRLVNSADATVTYNAPIATVVTALARAMATA